MATVSQVTQAVYQGVFQDSMSAGANAAAKSMTDLGTAVETTDTKIRNSTKSASQLTNALDPPTKAANQLAAAQLALSKAQDTMSVAVAAGSKTQDQANGVLYTLQARVTAANAHVDALSKTNEDAADSANKASEAHAGFTRELIVLGHEVVSGNYSRIPGSLLVLTERSGALNTIFNVVKDTFTSFGGLAAVASVAAVGGLAAIAAGAESTQNQLLQMQARLKATHDDFVSLGTAALAAAKDVAATSNISASDAREASQTITGPANASGLSQAQIADLIRVSGDLATMLGTTVPDAAKKLATALQDPASEAQELAKDHLPSVSFALADVIQHMQATGDTTGAFNTLLVALKQTTQDTTTQAITPFTQAWQDLGHAFADAGRDGKTTSDLIGDAVLNAATIAIGAITSLIGAIKNLKAEAMASAGGMSESEFNTPALKLLFPQLYAPGPGTQTEGLPGTIPGGLSGQITDFLNQPGAQAPLPLPPVPPSLAFDANGNPIGGANYQAFNTAQGAAIGVVNASKQGQIKALQDQIVDFKSKLNDLTAAGITSGTAFNQFSQAITQDNTRIAELSKTTATHTDSLTKDIAKVAEQIDAQQQLTDAYSKGPAAVAAVTAALQAQEKVTESGVDPKKRAADIATLTDEYQKLAQVTGSANVQKDITAAQQQADAQTAITKAYDGTAQSITHATDYQKAYAQVLAQGITDPTQFAAAVDTLTASYDKNASAAQLLQQEQQSVSAITDTLGNAFDQLGQGLVNAFLQGGGAAVNFGNIFKSLVSSILSQVATLAIVNPILNSLIPGSTKPTLGLGLDALGITSGAGQGGTGSILSLLGLGTQASGLTGGGILSGFGGGSFGNGLGFLGNINGAASSIAPSLFSSPGDAVGNAMFGAPIGQGALGSFTSLAGGAGAGFGIGSLAGSALLGQLTPHPQNAEIGSGIGALSAAQ